MPAKKKDIDREELTFLRECGYSWVFICGYFKVSDTWLLSWRKNNNFIDPFTEISDDDLDDIIYEYSQTNPLLGEVLLMAYFLHERITVTRERIRNSVNRVDPMGRQIRKNKNIKRREYHAYGPHAVWHLDGNHKLRIKYGIVIHGFIDGFSRFVLALRASDSNDKYQVLGTFISGCDKVHGKIPSLLRIDKGGENRAVSQFMLLHRGFEAPLSVYAGKSVANQRIERFWRDVNQFIASHYNQLFQEMQDIDILSLDCPNDMFMLHFMFLPDINNKLNDFINMWNYHKISTKNQKKNSPIQKLFENQHLEQNTMYYDIDNIERMIDDDLIIDQVVVNPKINPFTNDQYQLFQQELDRNNALIQLHDSKTIKMNKYIFACNVMNDILRNNM